MPSTDGSSKTAAYKGTVNPSRSAKQSKTTTLATEPESPPQESTKARTTRKAGMTRSAREAQRKLNHSVIEKARRTKINDALARLKQLVPAEFGRDASDPSEEPANKTGEDKEFKLDILVKTVSFVEHLLDRISALEEGIDIPEAEASTPSLKRKADSEFVSSKIRRVETAEGMHIYSSSTEPTSSRNRLPSISTFFNNIDPCLLPSPRALPISTDPASYLPSPPSSGQFETINRLHHPLPDLSLDSPAIPSSVGSSDYHGTRNPDDENAASLLLHMKTSPALLRAIPQTPSSMLGLQR